MLSDAGKTTGLAEIEGFLMAERAKVLSEAEWRFRMRGYGYDLTPTEEGIRVSRLPQNLLLGVLPSTQGPGAAVEEARPARRRRRRVTP